MCSSVGQNRKEIENNGIVCFQGMGSNVEEERIELGNRGGVISLFYSSDFRIMLMFHMLKEINDWQSRREPRCTSHESQLP